MRFSKTKINLISQPRCGTASTLIIPSLALVCLLVGLLFTGWSSQHTQDDSESLNVSEINSVESKQGSNPTLFPVTIRKPAGPPRVHTGISDFHGNAVTVSCSTCHATREPNFENKTVEDLNEFHGTLKFAHGTVSCLSCHNSKDYDALKLADGSRVEFTEVMTLCAQCHGPQMKEYEHGAHGGMNGYWDRTRGPRTKNNCVDCHNPHLPQFPKMQPTFKPRDRFLEKIEEH